jgi:glycosyltransferase involved in cell wall biosynthesis
VSVIVPARNEEACLGACLESLVSQTGIAREIIVVDDDSTDQTRSVARSFPSVQVIDPGPLPEGWIGKNNAVTAGAQRARGEWLLFTDADTRHRPGSLARAVAEAKDHGAALLSYSPEQEVHSLWEKAILPVIFAELASTYRPSEVSDRASPAAAANGQYLLVSRGAYDAVGGHAAVAACLLEDVALARAVKASGRKILFRYGGDAVRTRMYRSLRQLIEGWTKNLVLLFPSPGALAATRFAEFCLIVGSAIALLSASLGVVPNPWTRWGDWGGLGFLLAVGIACALFLSFFFKRIRKAHFSWGSNLLAIFGLPLFSYLLLRSKLFYKRGKIAWKGRTYTGDRTSIQPAS